MLLGAERVCARSGSGRSTDVRARSEIQTARAWHRAAQHNFLVFVGRRGYPKKSMDFKIKFDKILAMWKTVSGWIKSGFSWVKGKLSTVAAKISWPATLAIFFALVPLALFALYSFFAFAVSYVGIGTISTGLTFKTALTGSFVLGGLGLLGGCIAQIGKNVGVKAQKKKIEQLEEEEKELKKEKKQAKDKLYELEHGRKKEKKKKSEKEKKEKEERQKKAKKRLEKRLAKRKGKKAESSYYGYGNSCDRPTKNGKVKTNLRNWRRNKMPAGRAGSKKSVKNRYTTTNLSKYRKEGRYGYR